MDRERNPRSDEDLDEDVDDDISEAVVAADDTGLVANEINIVRAELEQSEEEPGRPVR
jgi:hypothetical protein